MSKIALFVICVLCLQFTLTNARFPTRIFGKVFGNSIQRLQSVNSGGAYKIRRVPAGEQLTFKYPKVTLNFDFKKQKKRIIWILTGFIEKKEEDFERNFVIKGIQHVNYGPSPTVAEILRGGIGKNQVEMTLTAPRGAKFDSDIILHGEKKVSVVLKREYMVSNLQT